MARINKLLSLAALLIIGTGAQAQTSTTPSIGGNVFGGGRMADVQNTTADVTATIHIYASTISGGVFGGNDITGAVNAGTTASAKITVHDKCDAATYVNEVYGGGNGYYYYVVGEDSTRVYARNEDGTKKNDVKLASFANTSTVLTDYLPTLGSTSVQVGDDSDNKNYIRLNEVYGGAKNAYVTGTSGVTVNSGTITKVFAGNNIGGTAASSSLIINGTKMPSGDARDKTAFKAMTDANWALVGDITTTDGGAYSGYGIGEAYGGGNRVDVLGTATVVVNGGYVNTLFGGNNIADMAGVPSISFETTSLKYINTVYGGGNKGSMKGATGLLTDCSGYLATAAYTASSVPVYVGTDIQVKSNTLFVNDIYGGCRSANVDNSTLVHVNVTGTGGYIGTVFGGCDISGTVGKTHGTVASATSITTKYDHSTATAVSVAANTAMTDMGTNIILTSGSVENVFGGGNGAYDYTSDDYKDYATNKPTVTSTWVDIRGNAGTVYGGGNAADIEESTNVCLYGAAVVGTAASGDVAAVLGAVYGGCKSANVTNATNVHLVNDGTATPTVNGNVFGGCDISGNVGDCTSDNNFTVSSDNYTCKTSAHLTAEPTSTTTAGYAYVKIEAGTVTGRVFGGGNGLQDAAGTAYYTGTPASSGTKPADIFTYPDGSTYAGKQLPVCQNTYVYVDKAIVGTTPSTSENEIHTIFGGGQGAGTKVMHNVYSVIGDGAESSSTVINGISYGGSYAGFVNSTCDDITKTTLVGYGTTTKVYGDIYGGSYGNYVRGYISLNINNVHVGDDDESQVAGIYAGNNNAGQPECNASINYVGNQCNVYLYGGGNKAPFYGTTRVTFTKGMVGYIYGGGNQAPVYGNTIVEVLGGHVCHDVFGGGNQGGVFVNKKDSGHNTYSEDYGGNTLVIVRDDCLKLNDAGTDFVADATTGNYSANYGTDLYSTTYFNSNDPDADEKGYHILSPNSAGKKSSINIEGNVYGGGNAADVEGKATVIIGNKQQ